jgi:PPE-repeat protein
MLCWSPTYYETRESRIFSATITSSSHQTLPQAVSVQLTLSWLISATILRSLLHLRRPNDLHLPCHYFKHSTTSDTTEQNRKTWVNILPWTELENTRFQCVFTDRGTTRQCNNASNSTQIRDCQEFHLLASDFMRSFIIYFLHEILLGDQIKEECGK